MLPVPTTAARYRVVSQQAMTDMLAVWCYGYEARDGVDVLNKSAAALEALHRFGLPHEPGDVYDPFEVLNFLRTAGLAGASDAWEHGIANARRAVHELGGVDLGGPLERHFRFTMRRNFDRRHLQVGRSLRLRIPGPLTCATQDVTTNVQVIGHADARIDTRTQGRVEVTLPPGDGPLAIEAQFDVRARAERSGHTELAPLSEDERRIYTAPREGFVSVTPKVQACADQIGKNAKTDFDVLRRAWELVTSLELGYVHYDALDPADPLGSLLSSRWINCQTGVALLVGLCRARGVPARLISGFCPYFVGPFYHYWAEVHLVGRGWIPVDVSGMNLMSDATDEASRETFFGRLDHRLKIECLPRVFTGFAGVRVPLDWYMTANFSGEGVENHYLRLEDRARLYSDFVASVPTR